MELLIIIMRVAMFLLILNVFWFILLLVLYVKSVFLGGNITKTKSLPNPETLSIRVEKENNFIIE